MKLYVNIGKSNDFQLVKLKAILSNHLTITEILEPDVDMMLITRWQESYLETNVKAIFIPFTGLNRFPLDVLKTNNIEIFNTHAKADSVAEKAFALTLSVLGKIVLYHNELSKHGRWLTREYWGEEFWHSLRQKRCGFIGMGHIASHIISYIKPFHCSIVNLERDRHKNLADSYVSSIDELIKNSDIIYLTCVLNEETTGIINNRHLELLKDKVIINVSRGEVIDEETLYLGLENELLLGAGIDVWYDYPQKNIQMPSQYDLSKFDNIVMSPHAACHTEENKDGYYEDIFDQIKKYSKLK